MNTPLRPGQEIAGATIEIIDPFEQPLRYGVGLLSSQLRDLPSDVHAPQLDVAALDQAAVASDDAAARELLKPIKDWLRREPPYDVLEAGSGEVEVPFLAAAAPDVDGATVTATQTTTATASGELSFKVAGTGPNANAKITIKDSYPLSCARGEAQVASVRVPVLWQLRAHPGNHDYGTWMDVEPVKLPGATLATIKVALVPSLGSPLVAKRQRIDLTTAGTLPGKPTYSYTAERSIGFTVGFKIASIGLEASLTASMEHDVQIDLEPVLPAGHLYEVQWLAGPPGVAVITPNT